MIFFFSLNCKGGGGQRWGRRQGGLKKTEIKVWVIKDQSQKEGNTKPLKRLINYFIPPSFIFNSNIGYNQVGFEDSNLTSRKLLHALWMFKSIYSTKEKAQQKKALKVLEFLLIISKKVNYNNVKHIKMT